MNRNEISFTREATSEITSKDSNLESGAKTSLRIAMFTAFYAPYLSGVSFGVQVRVRWLLQQGHEVLLIHPKIDEQYPQGTKNCSMPGLEELKSYPRFSSYAYPTKPVLFYQSCPEPRSYHFWSDTKLLAKFRPDLVLISDPIHLWGFNSLFLGGYGRPIAKEYRQQTGTPVISLFHTDYLTYGQYYLGNWLMKLVSPVIYLLFRRFSQAHTVNCFASRNMQAKYEAMGFKSCQYMPYLGIDCQKFQPDNIRYDPTPNDPRPTLLFVGRIASEKNILQLLASFSAILSKIPQAHLVIVGIGPEFNEVRQQAEKFGSKVTIWGASSGTELLGWFAKADIFVNPSLSENFCRTNMEALASGTPVVASDGGGNSEQIEPGVNGFLAEPNNPQDFAQKVVTILENPELKAQMTQQARPSVLKFDWSVCLKQCETQLYELVRAVK
jgi:glycosyltransferase involved in cell wall biosynthesis